MSGSDEILSLASLRRANTGSRRRPLIPASPGLFDLVSPETGAGSPLELQTGTPAAPETGSPTAPGRALPIGALPETPPPPAAREEVSVSTREAAPALWTVSGLVRHVRGLVEREVTHVNVEGEVSNWRPAGSGHCYFTVKDAHAQLSAVLFRRQASLLRFEPRDGDAVKLHGQLSVYEGRGQVQLIVEWMQQAGLGALLAQVQQLKERLRREGLFDRKRQLPPFPRCIGVVTSLQGAALRDIVKVCRRRHAAVNLLIYPAAVQGASCPAEIAAALRWFNAHPDQAEVVLVARGGGSWEDLHGFDHEQVARAIAASIVPVITGIGHATDSTIADAAADLCAPTPSAAAELLTAAQHRVGEDLARLSGRLQRAGHFELLRAQQRFTRVRSTILVQRLHSSIHRQQQRIDELGFRAQSGLSQALRSGHNRQRIAESRLARLSPAARLQRSRLRLEQLQSRLERISSTNLQLGSHRVEKAKMRLEALSPLRVLDRGYALVYGPEGRLLRSADQAPPTTELTVRLNHGELRAQVVASSSSAAAPDSTPQT